MPYETQILLTGIGWGFFVGTILVGAIMWVIGWSQGYAASRADFYGENRYGRHDGGPDQ